jgi:hypothetical protein
MEMATLSKAQEDKELLQETNQLIFDRQECEAVQMLNKSVPEVVAVEK